MISATPSNPLPSRSEGSDRSNYKERQKSHWLMIIDQCVSARVSVGPFVRHAFVKFHRKKHQDPDLLFKLFVWLLICPLEHSRTHRWPLYLVTHEVPCTSIEKPHLCSNIHNVNPSILPYHILPENIKLSTKDQRCIIMHKRATMRPCA